MDSPSHKLSIDVPYAWVLRSNLLFEFPVELSGARRRLMAPLSTQGPHGGFGE